MEREGFDMKNSYLDMLAWSGEGSAHPGGFSATVELLEKMNLNEATNLLDVGCGTGRTACYAAKKYNCNITGIDSRPLMIEKAKQRAVSIGVRGQFICGNALRMPFESRQFDIILAESVTIFTPIRRVIRELHRVIKPGGRVMNLELCKFRKIPLKILVPLFGIKQVPSIQDWINHYKAGGFRKVTVLQKEKLFTPQKMQDNEMIYPDHERIPSQGTGDKGQVSEKMRQVALFLKRYSQNIGYIVISAKK
jgi:arsenite methyltransferase